ncbi:MAG: ferrous iron transport protein B [Firmicutes bacterium]|nr:ferrous iron transport protein B [Bacillota bacterium]
MALIRIALVGAPNVGKSVIFNQLTGRYAAVSNYPGTTVEVSRGAALFDGIVVEVVDTPGTYSLLPSTEEEAVTRRLLWTEEFVLLLQVIDTKNLERSLPLTLALMEVGYRLVLVLNMYDEAEALGLTVNAEELKQRLGIPCVTTVGISGQGIANLEKVVAGELLQSEYEKSDRYQQTKATVVNYPSVVSSYLTRGEHVLSRSYPFSSKSVALLALEGDEEILSWLQIQDRKSLVILQRTLRDQRERKLEADPGTVDGVDYIPLAIATARREAAKNLVSGISHLPIEQSILSRRQWLDHLTLNPLTGLPLLALVVYVFLYRFVGTFGAGTLVDLLDREVFANLFNPFVNHLVDRLVSSPIVRELLAHEFGIFTLGLRYAVAVVFPIVTTFFASFALLEDSGYLTRLAFLLDRVFKAIGLSGKAIIPLTLGLGCGTMATLVTRTLETRRERIIATFILAMAVPCSAQLGVILALLSHQPKALLIWAATVGMVALVASTLLSSLLPGTAPRFILELPPLRWPVFRNVWSKTVTRVSWYFMEIMPLFILASVIIWLGRITGGLDMLLAAMAPLMQRLNLPSGVGHVFLYGFFRRDYGAAGLYDMQELLSIGQLTVAAVTLTLFIPCIAQLVMMVKERGLGVALAILASVIPTAFLVGMLLSRLLVLLGMM